MPSISDKITAEKGKLDRPTRSVRSSKVRKILPVTEELHQNGPNRGRLIKMDRFCLAKANAGAYSHQSVLEIVVLPGCD